MTKNTVTTIICDICKEEINLSDTLIFVDAQVYGRDFHKHCIESTAASFVVPMLVDDIYLSSIENFNTGVRGDRYYGTYKP